MEKKWLRRNIPDEGLVDQLKEEIGISSVLASLIAQRKINSFEEAKKFFNPSPDQLHDPFLMKGMSQAVHRIEQAIANEEKILFYGDYDVDGTTSVSLMTLFFRNSYSNIDYYVPDRHGEGYGISLKGIDYAASEGIRLVVAMDCGIKATEQIDYANNRGIDFIICDHHTPGEAVPKATAVLDPKQEDCPYPYKELSGCGLAFKLACALRQRVKSLNKDPFDFIDLVAVSIGCDIVPLTGENRVLAHYGMLLLNSNPTDGLKRLMKVSGFVKKHSITDVVFKIGPRINAAGRIAHAHRAVELLTGEVDDENDDLSKSIDQFNQQRKEFERLTVQQAVEDIQNNKVFEKSVTLVVHRPDWHKGVVGIVASKLIENFYKPTVVLTDAKDGLAVGSARSVEGFDVYRALKECEFLFEKFGGHQAAAGLTIKKENIEDFQSVFDDVVRSSISDYQLTPKVWYDQDLSVMSVNWSLFQNIERLGPFGPENMRPTFVSKNVRPIRSKLVGTNHLKFSIETPLGDIDCIAFNFGHVFEQLKNLEHIDICYSIENNEWQNRNFLQLNIKDLKIPH